MSVCSFSQAVNKDLPINLHFSVMIHCDMIQYDNEQFEFTIEIDVRCALKGTAHTHIYLYGIYTTLKADHITKLSYE